jgi:hypothetical protein
MPDFQIIKDFIKRTPLLKPLLWLRTFHGTGRLPQRPLLPEQKQAVVAKYGREFGLEVLVETGTYLGHMVEACKSQFEQVYSIELDPTLHKNAREKFCNDSHVHLLQGDSAKILPGILVQLDQSTLFWLDGHFSEGITARGDKDTPIIQELEAIFNQFHHPFVILIDDARLFIGRHDYPKLSELIAFVTKRAPNILVQVEQDIIRLVPVRK